MSPESSSAFIPPAPEDVRPTAPEAYEPKLIVMPKEMQQDIEAQRVLEASDRLEVQKLNEQAIEAARQIISNHPRGYEVTAPLAAQATPEDTDMGRSGLGKFYVPMPADPSKVPGWPGQTRR